MRSILSRGLCLVIPFFAAAAGHVGTEVEKEEERRRIANLIKQLGHNEYGKRERATDELKSFGEAALPDLREAAGRSDEQEVRDRAQRIIRAILLGTRKSKSTGMEFAVICAGEFQMGTPKRGKARVDETQHKVRIAQPFLLGAYEVTQDEFSKVMKYNPSWFSRTGGGKEKLNKMDPGRFPVETVTWFDAVEFCNRLSKLDGYEPYYSITDVKRDGDAIVSAKVAALNTRGYRLPTEAEWEFACRADTTGDFNFGFLRNGKEANFKITISGGYGGDDTNVFLGRTAEAGSYKPNNWGLYDMHGNAGEWCWDWHDTNYYANSPETDPTGPATGQHRVLRGGSWLVSSNAARSATRFSHMPDERKDYTGFRVARTP